MIERTSSRIISHRVVYFASRDCGRFSLSRDENVEGSVNDDRLPANGTRCASYRSGGIIGGESRTGLGLRAEIGNRLDETFENSRMT